MSDSLSLSLPRWDAKVKWRVRRPKPPRFWTVMFALYAVTHTVNAVLEILSNHWGTAACDTLLAGLWWRVFHLYRARADAEVEYLVLAVAIVTVNVVLLW